MATYIQWNSAITKNLLMGSVPGEPVYLSVDEDFVNSTAANYLQDKLEAAPLEDLLFAVRQRCIGTDRKVNLSNCLGRTKQGNCLAVGFLSVMVLAAFEMGKVEGQGTHAYFNNLRRLLGFEAASEEQARPPGMRISQTTALAPEEGLWEDWNYWLKMLAYIPTATPGAGPTRYIRYPISQTLLRGADTHSLRRFFAGGYLSQRI